MNSNVMPYDKLSIFADKKIKKVNFWCLEKLLFCVTAIVYFNRLARTFFRKQNVFPIMGI